MSDPSTNRTDRRPSRRAGLPRRAAFRVAAVMGGIVAALVTVEVVVRVGDLGPHVNPVFRQMFRFSEDPTLRYELVPGSMLARARINEHGMRGPETTVSRPEGVFRIACLGDSVVFGMNVGQDETYPAHLQRLLNARFAAPNRRFEVLNFAVTGYDAAQVARAMVLKAERFDPDLYIYGYCLNDPLDYSHEFEGLRRKITPAQDNYRQRIMDRSARLLTFSRVYLLVRYGVESLTARKAFAGDTRGDPQWISFQRGTYIHFFENLHQSPRTWSVVTRALADVSATARSERVPAYLVIYPVFRDLDAYALRPVHRKVAEEARRAGIPTVDLLDPFIRLSASGDWGGATDALHPDSVGHELAALCTIQRLLADGVIEGPGLSTMSDADGIEGELARIVLENSDPPDGGGASDADTGG